MEPKAKKATVKSSSITKRYIWLVELQNGDEYSSLGRIGGRNRFFATKDLATKDAESAIVDDIGEDFEHASVYVVDTAEVEKYVIEEQPAYVFQCQGKL